MAVQSFDDFGEVRQAPCEPVDLVDDNDVHLSGFHILQKTLHCRSFHGATGIAAIVITGGEGLPPFLTLAENEGFACFALSVEGVEGLLKALFGRLSGVDCTPLYGLLDRSHWTSFAN